MLHEELEKFTVLAEGRWTESRPIANKVFSLEAKKELEVIAKSLGAEYKEDEAVFEWVVTKRGTKFMSAPQILNRSGEAVVLFGNTHYPLNLSDEVDGHNVLHLVDVSESGSVYFLQIEVDDKPGFTARIRTKPNAQIPKSKIMSAFKSNNFKNILPYLHEDTPLGSMSDLPEEFTIDAIDSIKTQDDRTLTILIVNGNQKFWSPKGVETLQFPARAYKHADTLSIETPDGLKTFELSAFTKLKDLEIGDYQVVGWQVTNSKFGEGINIKVRQGDSVKWVNANTSIRRSINTLQPKLSDENPGLLTIEAKEAMSNGNIRVVCRFCPPLNYEDQSLQAFLDLEKETAIVW